MNSVVNGELDESVFNFYSSYLRNSSSAHRQQVVLRAKCNVMEKGSGEHLVAAAKGPVTRSKASGNSGVREEPGTSTTSSAEASAPCSLSNGTMEATLELLAKALTTLSSTSATNNETNERILSRLTAQRDLPQFTGNALEWLQFKQEYIESTAMCKFTDRENILRLRKCLRGAAREAVNALLIGVTSAQEIMDTLELQFGNGDVIINNLMMEVKKLPNISLDYYKDIVAFSIKVKNYVAAVRAIGRNEYLYDTNITAIITSKLPPVLIAKWVDYSYPLINEGKLSKLEILTQFLNIEAVKLSTSTIMVNAVNKRYTQHTLLQNDKGYNCMEKSYNTMEEVNSNNSMEKNICKYCKNGKHLLIECKKFKGASHKHRWDFVKKDRLCFKCISSRHRRESCTAPACSKEGCGKDHHQLLHFSPKHPRAVEGERVANGGDRGDDVVAAEVEDDGSVTNINDIKRKVLLKVVPINVHGPNGVAKVHALLDDGSTVSLVSGKLSSQLGLHGRHQQMRIGGAWRQADIVCDTIVINFDISNNDGVMYNINANSVSELNLPVQNMSLVKFKNYPHLCKIEKYICNNNIKPEILIGQDNMHLLMSLETIVGSRNAPCATRTPLGWCVHGCVSVSTSLGADRVLHVTGYDVSKGSENEHILREIQENMHKSFAIESMGVSGKPRQNNDELRAWEAVRQTATFQNGRWYVGLPWKDNISKMPNSYNNAYSRFLGVERKMALNSGYKIRYVERINHLLDNDYAEEMSASVNNVNRVWYLPHFGVDNPNKKKLRVVMDAAAKCNGFCLNDYLLKGPDLLVSLFGVMLRFRENKIGVTGDIKDMFLRVKLRHEDRSAMRFLWRDSPEKPLKTYVMSSLLFGANCSPFVAQFVKNENARRYESSMPGAVSAICNQHYMDDYIDSIPDEDAAKRLVRDVIYVHSQGGFEIRNWTSNNMNVLNSISKEAIGNAAVKFKIGENEGERTLGLIWFPLDDTIGFDVSFKKIPDDIISGKRQPTKREMLRVVMSIFDVYGFLSPFTIRGKIMLQNTWRSNIGWDEVVSNDIHIKWCEWLATLQDVRHLRIPRYYESAAMGRRAERNESNTCYTDLQLHVFCDASTKAMCAVAYWRWIDGKNVHVTFVASKCRVTPVRFVSVPRLELQAAVLAARLADTVVKEHKIKVQRRYFWSDSSTVLQWIRNNNRTYKTYVAHRLGEIDELTHANEWYYVPTKINIADVATRDNCNISIFENEWFKGPIFLRGEEGKSWPEQPDLLSTQEWRESERMDCMILVNNIIKDLPVPDILKFSSWLRLLRTTAVVYKFIDKCRKLTFTDDTEWTEGQRIY